MQLWPSSPPAKPHDHQMARHPRHDNADVVGNIAGFVGDEQFLFFALVGRCWRDAWQQLRRPKTTRAVVAGCTEARLRYCLGLGLSPRSAAVCDAIARLGKPDLLRWARRAGFPWGARTCAAAAEAGNVETIEWMRLSGCPWDKQTCHRAAFGGQLRVLLWARLNGCPWDAETCASAARQGHLSVLSWLRENRCPWDERTCAEAAAGGHLRVLEWARDRRCPWNAKTCEKVGVGCSQGGGLSGGGTRTAPRGLPDGAERLA